MRGSTRISQIKAALCRVHMGSRRSVVVQKIVDTPPVVCQTSSLRKGMHMSSRQHSNGTRASRESAIPPRGVLSCRLRQSRLTLAVLCLSLTTGAPAPAGEEAGTAAAVRMLQARNASLGTPLLSLRSAPTQPIDQYHVLVIVPRAGWQDDMPCLRPPESFRLMMPVRQPRGVLGTNREVLIAPGQTIVRVR